MARSVDRVAGSLKRVADNRVVNLVRRNMRRRKRAARGNSAQINRRNILQRADVLAHRRSLPTQNKDITRHF